MNKEEKSTSILALFYTAITCSVIVILFYVFQERALTPQSKISAEEPKAVFGLNDAFIMSRRFVEEKLKSSSSAKFGWEKDSRSFTIDDHTFFIRNSVESQNVFGVMLKTDYSCVIVYNPTTEEVSCQNLKFINQ